MAIIHPARSLSAQSDAGPLKFIADVMLGRLARWLRLLGYDTVYSSSVEDSLLLRIAREENRILLTRDSRIVKVRGLEHFLLLNENDPFEQLKKVIRTFHLLPHIRDVAAGRQPIHSKCSLCNAELVHVSRAQAQPNVPPYVYRTSASFRYCSRCKKYYWQGTHQERLREKLKELI